MSTEGDSSEVDELEFPEGVGDEPQDSGSLEFPAQPEIKEVPVEIYEEALVATEGALVAMGYPQEGADTEVVRRHNALEAGAGWLVGQGAGPSVREEYADAFAGFLDGVATRHEQSAEVARGNQDLWGTKPREELGKVFERRGQVASGLRDLANNVRNQAAFERAKVIT